MFDSLISVLCKLEVTVDQQGTNCEIHQLAFDADPLIPGFVNTLNKF
jgi:hypothetical protein